MSQFLEKSEQSVASARLLFDNHYYPSTVNRSYYACLRRMMHILFGQLKVSHGTFQQDVQRKISGGTHVVAAKLIGLALARTNKRDYEWFQRAFPELKQKRIHADYYPGVVSQEDGNDAMRQAISIIRILKSNFK